jgi:hypothetical protein
MEHDPELTPAPESTPAVEQPDQALRTLSNKQVEIFDRLRHVEERLDRMLERLRKCEDRTTALEAAQKPKLRRL